MERRAATVFSAKAPMQVASVHRHGDGMSRPLIVGLTGGIGSGKSAVADRFAGLGVPIIDSDVVARELVAPGQVALHEIRETFGEDCLRPDGTLDRAELRRRIFAYPELRATLEGILHPQIRREISQRIASVRAPYCVVVVPLLLESGMQEMMDRVVVVDIPSELQIERVTRRDGIGRELAGRMLAAQASREARRAIADHVIDNSGPVEQIDPQVHALDAEFRTAHALS
jgi:dephospho-CoA kinase